MSGLQDVGSGSIRGHWLIVHVLPALVDELEECEKVGDWEGYHNLLGAFRDILERFREQRELGQRPG